MNLNKKIAIFVFTYLLIGILIAFITRHQDNFFRFATIVDWPYTYVFAYIGWFLSGAEI